MAVYTFETMGTVVSIRIPDTSGDEKSRAEAVQRVRERFNELDTTFSLYRDDSEASRLARGELTLPGSSDLMRSAYAESLEWREVTSGAFTPHRPDGVIDLSGTIKAAGIRDAVGELERCGFETFSVNVGGDIATAGTPQEGAWVTGIVDPRDSQRLVAIVSLVPGMSAMATSGSAERGEHIWRRPETDTSFIQASVAAPDILTADVLATAIIAGGQETLNLVTARGDVGVLVVRSDGTLLGNESFRELITSAEAPTALGR